MSDHPDRPLQELIHASDLVAIDAWLGERSVVEVAEELGRLPREDRAIPFRLLAKDRALEVFEILDPALQQELLEGLRDANVRQLFEGLDPDDRARLTEEMPAKVAKRLLEGLSPHERRMTATLLGYPEDSAGRIMSPEVANLRAGMTVGEALERLRRIGRTAETIYALPVTDDERRLVGALGLRDLVLAPPDSRVSELMDTDVYSAPITADQEEVARLIRDADLLALPIVDTEGRLVGVVTVDDAMEILEEEDTEDVARAGGAEPLGRPYLSVSVLRVARSRVVWLLVLIAAASLTVNVLALFEDALSEAVQLALFIPLLIGTGGNTGAQAATTVTRAIALGEVRFADLTPVILREVRVGLLLGGMLAALAYVPVLLIFSPGIAAVVSLTLVSICTLATLVGALLPLLAQRVGADPAVMSAPFITTLVDASGLVVYLLIARAVLGS
ncbi:MAG TPA: magnesium transporter [Candidatus Limnocylindria bacterium]|nr:magnesium transporter [Candidatus Limnocylindria bacterium]